MAATWRQSSATGRRRSFILSRDLQFQFQSRRETTASVTIRCGKAFTNSDAHYNGSVPWYFLEKPAE